jgi:hypothetical protein
MRGNVSQPEKNGDLPAASATFVDLAIHNISEVLGSDLSQVLDCHGIRVNPALFEHWQQLFVYKPVWNSGQMCNAIQQTVVVLSH